MQNFIIFPKALAAKALLLVMETYIWVRKGIARRKIEVVNYPNKGNTWMTKTETGIQFSRKLTFLLWRNIAYPIVILKYYNFNKFPGLEILFQLKRARILIEKQDAKLYKIVKVDKSYKTPKNKFIFSLRRNIAYFNKTH